MLELQQPAVGAPDQFQRAARHGLRGRPRKDAGQVLGAQAEHRDQMAAAADAAALDLGDGVARNVRIHWISGFLLRCGAAFLIPCDRAAQVEENTAR